MIREILEEKKRALNEGYMERVHATRRELELKFPEGLDKKRF